MATAPTVGVQLAALSQRPSQIGPIPPTHATSTTTYLNKQREPPLPSVGAAPASVGYPHGPQQKHCYKSDSLVNLRRSPAASFSRSLCDIGRRVSVGQCRTNFYFKLAPLAARKKEAYFKMRT